MNQAVFVYGTLIIPEIQESLLGKKVKSEDAILDGYSANCIVYGQQITEYPFLMPNRNNKLKGKVFYSLTGHDLNLIKFYEGSEFVLADISVRVGDEKIDAITFMIKKKDRVEYGQFWDHDIFVREHLKNYTSKIIPELLRNYSM